MNIFYAILVDPTGVHIVDTFDFGGIAPDVVGQALFSPNGEKFAKYGTYAKPYSNHMYVFDFDRCSGILSNMRFVKLPDGYGACAISHNSQYLYTTVNGNFHQYDLTAPDIFGSQLLVGLYDGFKDPFDTYAFGAQLAPDGKIYLASTNGTKYFHVIHEPDEKGFFGCKVELHGLNAKIYHAFCIPNFPNYRLGPIDGSSCDSLGINNFPLADFRVRADSTLVVKFKDHSAYEPTSWSWNFGDGMISNDTSPVHTFSVPGLYHVCLTVSNVNGSNTFCRDVNLMTTSTKETPWKEYISVFPNPAKESFNVNVSDVFPLNASLRLIDVYGVEVHRNRIVGGMNTVNISDLLPGTYIWQLMLGDEIVDTGKLVKI